MMEFYRSLDRVEKAVFWLLLFAALYMVWQVGIRPFWNDPA